MGPTGSSANCTSFGEGNFGTLRVGSSKTSYNHLVIEHTSTSTATVVSTKIYTSNKFGMLSGLEILPCSPSIVPYHTGSIPTLGENANGYKWGQIYSTAASISTSDKNQKTDIENLSEYKDLYMKIFEAFDIVRYCFKNEKEETYTEKNHGRKHIGVIAQYVEKYLLENGISSSDFSGVCSDFFAPYYTVRHRITGGWRTNKVVDGVTYDYSENTYNWKHRNDEENPRTFEVYNEIIEKDISEMEIDPLRKQIGFITFEDNSKLTKEQPPIYINSIFLVDNNDNYTELNLTSDIVRYYEETDKDMTNPLSDAFINESGQLECHFNKIYSEVAMKLSESFDITTYKKIILDVDFISEYKVYVMPECKYTNANFWDHARNDQLLYDYGFRYDELFNLTAFVLQETRKEFSEYKTEAEKRISSLESTVNSLVSELNTIKNQIGG